MINDSMNIFVAIPLNHFVKVHIESSYLK